MVPRGTGVEDNKPIEKPLGSRTYRQCVRVLGHRQRDIVSEELAEILHRVGAIAVEGI
jgi:hypothetical protein